MTLKEYHRGQPSDLGPSRNPLAEVRWLAFLRGDAYANPFHDLVYAFSRSTAPKKEAVAVAAATGRRELYFGTCDLTLKDESGSTRTFSYEDVGHLKLHYQPDYYTHYESPLLDTAVLVTFFADGKRVELRSRVARVEFIRLCKMLLEQRVPFREFHSHHRSFLLRTDHSYREVQEIKERYGIDW